LATEQGCAVLRRSIHAGLNNHEQALVWPEKAFRERSAWIACMRMDPWFDKPGPDPRFQDLLRAA